MGALNQRGTVNKTSGLLIYFERTMYRKQQIFETRIRKEAANFQSHFRSIVTTACKPSSRNVSVAFRSAKSRSNLPRALDSTGAIGCCGDKAVPCTLHLTVLPSDESR